MELVTQDKKNELQTLAQANSSNEITITTLEIAELTGKRHDHILRDCDEQLTKIVGAGGMPKFGDTYTHPQNKQTYRMYRLPKREALILVSGYSVELRAKIIDRLEFLENELKNQVQYKLPQTYKEALIELVNQVEKNEVLQLTLEKQKPLVDFANQVANASNAISVGDFAKLLKDENISNMGQNNLFKWLRDNNYLMKSNMPYQKYIDSGYFEIIEQTYETPYGTKVSLKTLVTGKGQIYFAEKLRSLKNSKGAENGISKNN